MADPDPPPQQTSQQSPSGIITINMTYLKSPQGIMKIVEFFLLMLAFACAAEACYNCGYGKYSFFIFATVVPWLLCLFIFIMFFFCLVDKININWNLTVLGNSVIWAIVLLISSSLWATVALNGSAFYASVVFGFISIIAFIVDIVFLFRANR